MTSKCNLFNALNSLFSGIAFFFQIDHDNYFFQLLQVLSVENVEALLISKNMNYYFKHFHTQLKSLLHDLQSATNTEISFVDRCLNSN